MDEGFLADIKIVEQMDSDMIRRYLNLSIVPLIDIYYTM